MGLEHREGQSPFRIEVKPMIEGSNPDQEPKFKSSLGEINNQAVLQERVYLFDGDQYTVMLGDSTVRARSFVDIRLHYFPDGDRVYHPFAYWGLKDADTEQDIQGYTDASIAVDPIYIFRIAKILEALPQLSTNSDQYIDDYCSAATAAARTYYSWDFEEPRRQEMIERRHRIVSLIGRDKWRGIIQMIPPQLEEMMQTMQEREIGVMTGTLEREFKTKRLGSPSEFYSDMIDTHHNAVEDIARGLEETGGRW